jgi:hypothetical protein
MINLELPDLPDCWGLAHIISLDPCWQVGLSDKEHFVVATGDTVEDAWHAAIGKIIRQDFIGRLYTPQDFSNPPPNLQAVLEGMGVLRKRDPAPWIEIG